MIEIPPGTGPGTVDDAFRIVTDTGPPGHDQGKGGKHLILPPDHVHIQGEVPDDYYVSKSPSDFKTCIAAMLPAVSNWRDAFSILSMIKL